MTDILSFRGDVNSQHVLDFLFCIEDIIDAANELKSAGETNAVLRAISSARRMSVPLRKLLLDGNGHLFKSCFMDPGLHPLKKPTPGKQPITFVQKFKRPEMTLGWADGSKETIEVPEYEQKTTIHPLYGVHHSRDQEFVIEMPFDYDSNPLKFRAWMNTKVLEVDGMLFSAKDLLREVVNNEGAHIGEGIKFALPDTSTLSMDSQKNKRYKAVNAVKFGGLSYAQLFCLWTGIYLAHRSKALISDLPFDYSTNTATVDICKKIDQSPKELSGRGKVENQTYHALIIGSDNKLRSESIGDYSAFVKIP